MVARRAAANRQRGMAMTDPMRHLDSSIAVPIAKRQSVATGRWLAAGIRRGRGGIRTLKPRRLVPVANNHAQKVGVQGKKPNLMRGSHSKIKKSSELIQESTLMRAG